MMDWEERIQASCRHLSDAYKIDHPELIDVKGRFCRLDIDGKTFVAKRSEPAQAQAERNHAMQAQARLDGCIVDGLSVWVVVPEVVCCTDASYLITPYLGKTLQSIRYLQTEPLITADTLQALLRLFQERGIRYRGFLPRNTILRERSLCLIDWEDVAFYDWTEQVPGSVAAETNFILNWMYIFEAQTLRTMFRSVYPFFSEQNKPLNRYETSLCCLCGQATDSASDARQFIETVVLAAEAPLKNAPSVSILPTDCASVIADIFSACIDAFFDLLSANLRREEEVGFGRWLDFLGAYIRANPNQEPQTRSQIFSILLLMYLAPDRQIDRLRGSDASAALCKLQQLEQATLLKAYLGADVQNLKQDLWPMLRRVTGNPNIETVESAQMLVAEIISLSEARNYPGKLVWENAFYRFLRSGRTATVPGSYVLLRKQPCKGISDLETKCYADSIRMTRRFLKEHDVPITGIYTHTTREGKIATLILPYHLAALKALNIPPDEYQPYTERYLGYYDTMDQAEQLCETFDHAFGIFAADDKGGDHA